MVSLIHYAKTVWNYRYLVKQLVVREFKTRYSGSFFGLFWSFITPLIMLIVYTFVFNNIFHAKWGTGNTSNAQVALVLFAGLIIFGLFSDCAIRAPTLIQNHVSYVKRVVFPLEILPLVLVINALLHAMISLFVLMIFCLIINHGIDPTVIFIPLIMIPFLIFIMGIVMYLSALGVFIRDMAHLISVATTIIMFATPIFYPLSAVPVKFQTLLYLNPLTFAVEQIRSYALFNQAPDWKGLIIYFGLSLLVFYIGITSFQKGRKGFADVL